MAISNESVPENRLLAAKHGLGFPILSDPHMTLVRKLGMVHEKANPIYGDAARPGIYVIDRDARIRALFIAARIRTRPDPAEVIAAVRSIR